MKKRLTNQGPGFFLYNLAFCLAGFSLLTIGLHQALFNSQYYEFIRKTSALGHIYVVNLVIAIVIISVSLFACCGSVGAPNTNCQSCENSQTTKTYALLLGFILVFQIGTLIGAIELQTRIPEIVKTSMETKMEDYMKLSPDEKNHGTHSWDIIQQKLKCCGIYNYTDWSEMMPDSLQVPDPCCKKFGKNCGNIKEEDEENIAEIIHITGCFDQIESKFQSTVFTAIGCIISIILLLIVGILLAFNKLKNSTISQDDASSTNSTISTPANPNVSFRFSP